MQKLSIFKVLQQQLGDALPIIELTKATLVHLSHTLEDFVLRERLPALLFTGFQESSHWREETKRYRELAEVAMQVCIFAGKPLPQDQNVDVLQVELDDDDPLLQEWFLAIFCTDFTVVLCGLDNHHDVTLEAQRRFRTVWSFDVDTVNSVLDVLEDIIEDYRPEMLPQLQHARATYPPVVPRWNILSTFVTELLAFEDKLRQDLLESQNALEISDAIYHTVIVHAPLAILLTDPDGKILFASGPHLRHVFEGRLPNVGDDIYNLVSGSARMTSYIRETLNGNDTAAAITTSDGSVYEFRSRRIYYSGVMMQVLFTMIDVTEQIKTELARRESEQLRKNLQAERQLAEARRQLMYTLAHELRTPLATIQTSTDLLELYFDRLTPEKRETRLRYIQEQVKRLNAILHDIDMAVISDGSSFTINPTSTDLYQMCGKAVEVVQGAYPNPIHFSYDRDGATAMLDQRWFQYALTNLLNNAAKYSPNSEPVDLTVGDDTHEIVIEVRDRGIGIPETDQQRLFEPFFRGSNVGTIGGTGLGLVIIRNIVRAHGGTLTIDSEMGQGTVATVRLPTSLVSTP